MNKNTISKADGRNIEAGLHSLNLMKAQISIDGLSTNRKCKDISELSKILKIKNNQQIFSKNHRKQIEQSDFSPNNLTFPLVKVLEQKQRIIQQIKQKPIPNANKFHQKTFNTFLQFNTQASVGQASNLQQKQSFQIIKYVEMQGWTEMANLCYKFRIKDEQNLESISNLVECFNSMCKIEDGVNPFGQEVVEFQYCIQDIEKCRQFFEELIQRKHKAITTSYVLEVVVQKQKQVKKVLPNFQYVWSIAKLLEQYSAVSFYEPRYRTLNQYARLSKTITIFLPNQKQNYKRFKSEQLKDKDFWEKICYLFSRGEGEYYLIDCHLKEHNQEELLHYFNQFKNGCIQAIKIQKNNGLFQSNKFYRQFVLLLSCKCLEFHSANEQEGQQFKDELLYYALRQISILHTCKVPYQQQVNYIIHYCQQLLNKLGLDISENKNADAKQKITKLFALGYYSQTISMLHMLKRINTLEYATLLAILYQFDIVHSQTFVYSHKKTVELFRKVFKLILNHVKLEKQSNLQQYKNLFMAYCPKLQQGNQKEKSFWVDILTENKQLFQYIITKNITINVIQTLSLESFDILKLIDQSIKKHKTYAFGLQLLVGSCIEVSALNKIVINDSQEQVYIYDNQTKTRKVVSKFLVDCDIFMGFASITPQERLNFLFEGFNRLIIMNISLLKSKATDRECLFEEATFINKLYLKIRDKEIIKLMQQFLNSNGDSIKIQAYNEQFERRLNALLLTFSMLQLKQSIFQESIEQIVSTINEFYLYIAGSFNDSKILLDQIYPNKYQIESILAIFASDIIQALALLKKGRPRVIERNRNILKSICREIYVYLQDLRKRSNEAHTKMLFERLEKVMVQFSYF